VHGKCAPCVSVASVCTAPPQGIESSLVPKEYEKHFGFPLLLTDDLSRKVTLAAVIKYHPNVQVRPCFCYVKACVDE
jgi:hypothetical protein